MLEEEAIILLNRQLCIHPDVWNNSHNLRKKEEWFRRRMETETLTYEDLETFTALIEKAEDRHQYYVGYINRLQMFRNIVLKFPPCIMDSKHETHRILGPTIQRFKQFIVDTPNGRYAYGKIDRVMLYKIEAGVRVLLSKCYKVRITLIMIRRFRKSELSIFPKEIVNMIAMEVWKTRFEEVWYMSMK
jgi:hypothetical protein